MLTAAQIDTFHHTGFLRIPGLFQGEELRLLQEAASRVEAEGLARGGEHHLYRRLADGSEAYFRSEKLWSRDAIFRAATVHPGLLAAVGQCIGHSFLPWNDSLVSKQPHTETPIPFHQDPPYFKPDLDETVGIPDFVTDVYLRPSTVANGCVHGIPGKHLLGTIDLARYSEDELFSDCGAEPIEMQPGDVLFHALSAPHGSRANHSDSTRTTFYLKYQADAIEDWKDPATRSLSYDERGIAMVRTFIDDRRQLGFAADLGADLVLGDRGFHWRGQPTTPPYHWRALGRRLTPAQRAAARELRIAK